jgi:membrane-associated phospholipid phosphatase
MLGAGTSAFITFGRMYSCMHSLFDVVTGAAVAAAVVSTGAAAAPSVLHWMHTAPAMTVVGCAALVVTGAVACYPRPLEATPSITDIIAFLGASFGVSIGAAVVRGDRTSQPPVDFTRAWDVANVGAQVALGVALTVVVKEVARRVCGWVLGAAFDAAPPLLRRLWQLPMHGAKQVSNIVYLLTAGCYCSVACFCACAEKLWYTFGCLGNQRNAFVKHFSHSEQYFSRHVILLDHGAFLLVEI